MKIWLSIPVFAALVGVSRQSAYEYVSGAKRSGRRWRDCTLDVKESRGRGGRGGVRLHVALSSLPADLQKQYHEALRPVQTTFQRGNKASQERAWWPEFLAPVLAHPPRSAERAAAKKALVGKRVAGPDGFFAPSSRDIDRKVAILEGRDRERADVVRKPRKGKGEAAVLLTRMWDSATVGLGADRREDVARRVKQRRKDLWGKGTSYGDVKLLLQEFLVDLTIDAGLALRGVELEQVCRLPKHFVETDRGFRRVHQMRTDAKAFADALPRVQLTSAGLLPMQIVYGDVHHFDLYLMRDDGKPATPKGIAWLDAANRRLRFDIVLCEPGTAIRNEDLIGSFISMTQDPRWGMPARLYLDNGSEYRFADFAEDALHLAGLDCVGYGGKGQITRAQAYNAPAKGNLEGSFRIFEQTVLSRLPGYIGGDRMKSKTANVGKAPVPYPGTFEQFCKQVEGLMLYWMHRPQTGDRAGVSPEQKFGHAVEQGWQRTDIDPHDLMMAFSAEATRDVRKGTINVGGRTLYSDKLLQFNGEKVRIREPRYLTWNAIPFYPLKGGDFIDVAVPEEPYRRDDPAGAVEAARRKKAAVDTVRGMAAELNDVDVTALMIESGQRKPQSADPKSRGTIRTAKDNAVAGRRIVETPSARIDRETEERRARQKERYDFLKSRGDIP